MFLEHNSNIVPEFLDIIMLYEHNVSGAYFVLRHMPVSYVKDPSIVGSMSGHKEGSKALARYRDIDQDIKKDALSVFE